MEGYMDMRELVATVIIGSGALRFGQFRLKLHESNPEAPLSPVYLNLRTSFHPDPNKRGPLTEAHCSIIGRALADMTVRLPNFQGFVAGLPYAADPFVGAVSNMPEWCGQIRFVSLAKYIDPESGNRCIVPERKNSYPVGRNVVLWDDLITMADSKIEAANSLMLMGCDVTDIIVLVDCQQGGSEKLVNMGFRVHSILPFLNYLLPFARQTGYVEKDDWDRCCEYFGSQGHPLSDNPTAFV
ncbi:MAG: hypothetical protein HGB08_00855 [Candidatus Moranbacteria bacterium]|nr:hypothetical protein [Candidatus Moranbacteria bacterium]